MLFKADNVDKVQVGIEYVFGCLAVECAYQQGNNPLGDDGVAVGGKKQTSVSVLAAEPNAALAALYEVALCFFFLVDDGAVLAKLNKVAVLVQPLVEVGELVDDLFFYFLYCHC